MVDKYCRNRQGLGVGFCYLTYYVQYPVTVVRSRKTCHGGAGFDTTVRCYGVKLVPPWKLQKEPLQPRVNHRELSFLFPFLHSTTYHLLLSCKPLDLHFHLETLPLPIPLQSQNTQSIKMAPTVGQAFPEDVSFSYIPYTPEKAGLNACGFPLKYNASKGM